MSHEGNDEIMDQIRDELSEELINMLTTEDIVALTKDYILSDWVENPDQFKQDLRKYGSKLPMFNEEQHPLT